MMKTIGNLTLLSTWCATAVSEHWLAREDQTRNVWVERLTNVDLDLVRAQLGHFRAQRNYEHPRVSRVTRIVDEGVEVYAVREMLHGTSVRDLMERRHAWGIIDLLDLLIGISEVCANQEAKNCNTLPLSTRRIFWNDEMGPLMDNTVQFGARDPQRTNADMQHLGVLVQSIIPSGLPGANRLLQLCLWMQGIGLDYRLQWQHVGETCNEILTQLQEG